MTTDAQSQDAAAEPLSAGPLSISLTVKDLQQSLAWYRDVVGFTVANQYERDGKVVGIVVAAGDVSIFLNQDDGARGWDRVKGEGFSMSITTTQNVDAIADRIRAGGGSLESEPADMPWGVRAFRLKDPDGYKFAIQARL